MAVNVAQRHDIESAAIYLVSDDFMGWVGE